MPLTSVIRAYDSSWPAEYRLEADRLVRLFHQNKVAIHHVGSTAVSGLAAKPEIDILVEVRTTRDYTEALAGLGYARGKDLSAGHQFYKKNQGGVRTHKIHVCEAGHPTAEAMKRFLEILTRDEAVRRGYEHLKLELEASNKHGISEYLAGKESFIRKALEQANAAPK